MPRPTSWDNLSRGLDGANLPDLLREIYQRVPEARALIATRLAPTASEGAARDKALSAYRRRIIAAFRPKSARAGTLPDVPRARRAIRDYRSRTRDLAGTIDLLLTFVDEGLRAVGLLGAPPSSLIDSLHAAADDIRDALRSVPRDQRPALWIDRLRGIERSAPSTHGLRSALDALAAAFTA